MIKDNCSNVECLNRKRCDFGLKNDILLSSGWKKSIKTFYIEESECEYSKEIDLEDYANYKERIEK